MWACFFVFFFMKQIDEIVLLVRIKFKFKASISFDIIIKYVIIFQNLKGPKAHENFTCLCQLKKIRELLLLLAFSV